MNALLIYDSQQYRHSPSERRLTGLDDILLGSLDRIWQFCNMKIGSFASSSGTSGERKKSAFGKLFSSQNTEAEQTFQPSLAGHHSHPMYLFFFSDKRATFGIAQAAELIIATPRGCFKLWAYPPLMSWNTHNHQAESGKPCSLSDVG